MTKLITAPVPARPGIRLAALALACAALAAGCSAHPTATVGTGTSSTQSSGSPKAAPPPSPSIPAAASPAPSPVSIDQIAKAVALTQADMPAGVTLALIPEGDQVAGEVTLDFCNGNYTSENSRIARWQVAGSDASDNLVVSSESVVYSSPAAAQSALQEVRAALVSCPINKYVPSNIEGVGDLKYTLKPVPPDSQLGSLTADHVVVYATTTDTSGDSGTNSAIYERVGSVMVAVYGTTVSGILPYAHIVEQRLEALPASEIG